MIFWGKGGEHPVVASQGLQEQSKYDLAVLWEEREGNTSVHLQFHSPSQAPSHQPPPFPTLPNLTNSHKAFKSRIKKTSKKPTLKNLAKLDMLNTIYASLASTEVVPKTSKARSHRPFGLLKIGGYKNMNIILLKVLGQNCVKS